MILLLGVLVSLRGIRGSRPEGRIWWWWHAGRWSGSALADSGGREKAAVRGGGSHDGVGSTAIGGWPGRAPMTEMRAVLTLAAHELRARWLSWAVLVLIVGLAGGAVLGAAAGARRTDQAYARFLAAYQASDVLVGPAEYGIGGYDDALAGLPGVAAIAPVVGLQALPLRPGGQLDAAATVAAPLDQRYGQRLEIPKMGAGRQPEA